MTATFTGVMLTITNGSFIVPLVIAGGFCILGALAYLFLVGEIAPLPPLAARAAISRAGTAQLTVQEDDHHAPALQAAGRWL